MTFNIILAGNYMFKVNNRNTRTRCEICSKLTKLKLTLKIFYTCGSIVNFEQVNAGWDKAYICNFADDRSLYSIEDNFKS